MGFGPLMGRTWRGWRIPDGAGKELSWRKEDPKGSSPSLEFPDRRGQPQVRLCFQGTETGQGMASGWAWAGSGRKFGKIPSLKRCWKGQPRTGVESPSLEGFKTHVDVALGTHINTHISISTQIWMDGHISRSVLHTWYEQGGLRADHHPGSGS